MKKNYQPLAKHFSIFVLLLAPSLGVFACDACKKQQPKFLQDISHGAGPDSNWDYLIVTVMVAITFYVLVATVKCLFKPAEKDAQHIKRMILNDTL